MQDVIRLLPDSVANQIAAGEVIRRPSNVVKELVENAVDAGATEVQVIIKDAGRTLVQIVDNGCGMSQTDARMAFERHSTSKIRQADDMFALHTMGFRGEALASIAAIAQIDMRTMRQGDTVGTRLIINGSRVESQKPEACAPGTNIMVKNLFYNVPARRKFLRKDASEMAQIMQEFQRMALVNEGVRLSLVSQDKPHTSLMPATFKQRITDLFGQQMGRQLLPISTKTSVVNIEGYIGTPQSARRRCTTQYLMVNGRHMRHPYFHKAILHCYEGMIGADMAPSYFVRLTVDPSTIDVNVHPQKEEIKFEQEAAIWQILTAAVREGLGRFGAGADIDFDTADAPDIPIFKPDNPAKATPPSGGDPSYNPFDPPRQPAFSRREGGGNVPRDWEQLYQSFASGAPEEPSEPSSLPSLPETEDTDTDSHTLQLRRRYILTPCRSGLMIVDQHRAHIRVLYDSIVKDLDQGPLASQRSMFPDMVTLTPEQTVVLQHSTEQVTALGFDISYLGDNAWSVEALPALSSTTPPQTLLADIADALRADASGTDLRQRLITAAALAIARSAATAAGTPLTAEQMDTLLAQLLLCPAPNYTPDGQPVITIIDADTLLAPLS